MAAIDLAPNQYGSIYYPGQTVTILGVGAGGGTPADTINSTSLTVYDIDHNTVATQTGLSLSATSITIASGDTWTGSGGAVAAGWYMVQTSGGLTFYFCVCPANPSGGTSNLYNPSALSTLPGCLPGYPAVTANFAAWVGTTNDRDAYQYPSSSTATMLAWRASDPYFTFTQDTARPHTLWIGTNDQSVWSPPATGSGSWQALAAAIAGGGYPGATYEVPTNEFQFAGASWPQVATQYAAVRAAILNSSGDPTAKVIGPCSAGASNGTTGLSSYLSNVASFLAAQPHGGPGDIDGWSEHLENSWMNEADAVLLRQYFGGLKTAFANAGIPNLPVWWTETGIVGSGYGVYHPRREARQRTFYRLVSEQYGWPKEQAYDFRTYYPSGSGLPTYMVEPGTYDKFGIVRAGIYALHVMSEALYGTTCTTTSPPVTLSFGTVGDSFYVGSHYTSTARDVVVLATNGIESDTVTLNVSNTAGVTAWDGMGRTITPVVTSGQVTVPVNDLLTYVFLASGTTVSVNSTGSAVQNYNSTNTATVATTVNEASTAVGLPGFAATPSGASGAFPYLDLTVPGSLTATLAVPATLTGFVLRCGLPWKNNPQQGATPADPYVAVPTAFTIQALINSVWTAVYTYNATTAVSYPIPVASTVSGDSFTRTTFWRQAWSFAAPLTAVGATAVRLNITATSYGSQPDTAASAVFEQNVQAVTVSQFEVYQAPAVEGGPLTSQIGGIGIAGEMLGI